MDPIFIYKLTLSFLIGGSWVVIATVLADKFGSKIGGLISGLPSTVMFGLFFLAWTQNTEVAVKATTIIPIVGGINCLFLVSYMYLVKKSLSKALLSSLFLWSIFSYFLVRINFNNYVISLGGYVLLLVTSFYLAEKVLKIPSVKGRKIRYTPSLVIIRSLIGGVIVALAVYLGKIGGPILGGMFSMFPAMFISTMLITYFSHGALFSAGTMKSSMVSGISIVIYSLITRFVYLPLGLTYGTLISIIGAFLSGLVIYKLVITKFS